MPKKNTARATEKAAKKTTKKVVPKAAKKVSTPASPEKGTKKAPKPTVKKTAAAAVKKSAPKTVKKIKKKTTPSPDGAPARKSLKKVASGKTSSPETTRGASAGAKADADDSKPSAIVFSFEDVEQLMAAKKRESKAAAKSPPQELQKKAAAPQPKKVVIEEKPQEHRKLGAASLADILGFNPAEKKKNTALSSDEVPQKWKKYYKLLIDLRIHVRDEIDLHSSDTLKHSTRDDSGDLSGYGNHQADMGTDNFDRDFALSLVSNEHEALNEIEDAIQRIKKGTYGVCEVTGKAIPAARLTAVPFARYSIEGQAEYEKNLRRKIDRSGNTGLFGDTSDAPKISADDDDE